MNGQIIFPDTRSTTLLALLCCAALTGAVAADAPLTPVGAFESHADVGITPKKGSVEYTASTREYRVTGSGANIWGTLDAFQFAWTRLSGDLTLAADVQFVGTGKVAHRKAVLMIRQSLEPNSAYVDVALHGDGLTALQFRPTAGAETQEIRSKVKAPQQMRIERRGNQFTIYAGKPGEDSSPAGPATVSLHDPVYVGMGVCSHDADVLETAVFSNLKITAAQATQQMRYRSKISIYNLKSKSTRIVYTADRVFEAPNWSLDGRYLLISSEGSLFRIPLKGTGPASPERLNVDPSFRCNNDKAISPDGKQIAMSCSTPSSQQSQVFLARADGSRPKLMVAAAPSYFHAWSPDGRWLAFVGQRGGNFDLFRVSVTGGAEERLTSDPAYDDGPDYSADGKWIYFNSDRSSSWDIWRMPGDGAGSHDLRAERVTSDELEDWFPHPSPDGKWLVFLSFPHGTTGHDARTNVQLRIIGLPGTRVGATSPQSLNTFLGGQGTINVNSWSPDSAEFAFVVYEKLQ